MRLSLRSSVFYRQISIPTPVPFVSFLSFLGPDLHQTGSARHCLLWLTPDCRVCDRVQPSLLQLLLCITPCRLCSLVQRLSTSRRQHFWLPGSGPGTGLCPCPAVPALHDSAPSPPAGGYSPHSTSSQPHVSTLDEPLWQTVMRDVKRIWANLVLVVFPFKNRDQQSSALRNWDLWGPMVRSVSCQGCCMSRVVLLIIHGTDHRHQ